MKDQKIWKEFVADLSLTVPYFQSYHMIDWGLAALSLVSLLLLVKSLPLGLLLLTISDLAWVIYDLYNSEYPQGLLFLVYAVLTAWGCLESYREKLSK